MSKDIPIPWIPAFAGMTVCEYLPLSALRERGICEDLPLVGITRLRVSGAALDLDGDDVHAVVLLVAHSRRVVAQQS